MLFTAWTLHPQKNAHILCSTQHDAATTATRLQVGQPLEPVDARDVVVVKEEGAQGSEAPKLQRSDVGDLVATKLQDLRAVQHTGIGMKCVNLCA